MTSFVDRPIDQDSARQRTEQVTDVVRQYFSYPGHRRGIVIAGGGRYFPCAWVCVKQLRRLGCTLPIELWYLGPDEMSPQMLELMTAQEVACIDAHALREIFPASAIGGWELKAYAMLHSRFSELLLLDADNFPVQDPTFLFDSKEFRDTGAIFWPDYPRPAIRDAWDMMGMAFRDEPEFESGQIVIDRDRCRAPLLLAMWMNNHSAFWYRHMLGDKETFHLAWRKLGVEFVMPPHPIQPLRGTMCQHDFSGRRLFQHRNLCKWRLFGHNPKVDGFIGEDAALASLDELRRVWQGAKPEQFDINTADEAAAAAALDLCGKQWQYTRRDHDSRPMSFGLNGNVVEGEADRELTWNISTFKDVLQLRLYNGTGERTCTLTPRRGSWIGFWEIAEKMEVELSPKVD